jgi:hypothetical protein
MIAGFLAEAAVITALLYYFGWVRTQSMFEYFGIDAGWLGYSTVDYVHRSIDSTFATLLVTCVVVVAITYIHGGLLRLLSGMSERHLYRVVVLVRWAATTLCLVFAVALVADVLVGLVDGWAPFTLPAVAVLLLYSDYLATSVLKRQDPHGGRLIALSALLVIGAFWAVAAYATTVGSDVAERFAHDLSAKPDIVLYSAQRLDISGTGVMVVELPKEDNRYRFRYNGLRMLAYTEDRLVLLPAGWRHGRDHAFVLPNDDKIRMDIYAQGNH